MSQHLYKTTYQGIPVTVILGWDRPLSYFFLVIEADEPAELDDKGILYSNLNDPDAGIMPRPLSYYRGKLDELGIQVPESMFLQTELDQLINAGNRQVWHWPDGTYADIEEEERC